MADCVVIKSKAHLYINVTVLIKGEMKLLIRDDNDMRHLTLVDISIYESVLQ